MSVLAPEREQSRARYPDEEGYVGHDGVRVFYEVYGHGSPTVFLLPTWSIIHSRHWKMQIPYLARHFRVLTFDGRARFGTAHWKLEALDAYAGDRPLAWIDDSLDESCHEWARQRTAPTLLCPTESHIGLTDAHTEALLGWAREGYTATSGP